MPNHENFPIQDDLDAICRRALSVYRLEAFDNVDIDQFLALPLIPPDVAVRIGNHLMRNGHHINAYNAGQNISRVARALIQAHTERLENAP